MIKPTIQFTSLQREQFLDATRGAARRLAHAELTVLGNAWEEEVVAIVQAELPRREGERHKVNTTHLEESFTHHINEGANGGFPMTLDLTIKPGVNAKRVAASEYGSDHDYEISPSGVTVGFGGRSINRRRAGQFVKTGFQIQDTKWLRWTSDESGEEVFMQTVTHKAFPGVMMMHRARDAVLARFPGRR